MIRDQANMGWYKDEEQEEEEHMDSVADRAGRVHN